MAKKAIDNDCILKNDIEYHRKLYKPEFRPLFAQFNIHLSSTATVEKVISISIMGQVFTLFLAPSSGLIFFKTIIISI